MASVVVSPLERISRVSWPGNRLLVVSIRIQRFGTTSTPANVEFRDLTFRTPSQDVFASGVKWDIAAVRPIPSVVDPVSKEMLNGLYGWGRTPFFSVIEEGMYFKSHFFFNLPRVRSALRAGVESYEFVIRTPATGPTRHLSGTAWYVWDTGQGTLDMALANPVTAGDPRNVPYGVITLPFITASEAEATALSIMVTPSWLVGSRPVDFDVIDAINWRVRAATYKKRRSFPLIDLNDAGWDEGEAVSASDAGLIGDSDTHPLPAKDLRVSVNLKTLQVTTSL
jgi:hypothetical protein